MNRPRKKILSEFEGLTGIEKLLPAGNLDFLLVNLIQN